MTPAVICANIARPGDTIHHAAQISWLDPQLRLEI